ncbi:hypothetical protein [Streptacidiphilus jiangxiensis]|uniref:Uncharacterized protein n=1 Tax=Streptacidiphilus jiangxiensis TaxID=235985 RepID=A0A1H7QYL8_STRJI|nr:hypothetical protein [Streptacidiphilus jiangxiensis]SEL52808.1 hypothetical protein SAMN05414137_109276 [Streptacidiphilus jiangxiensis]
MTPQQAAASQVVPPQTTLVFSDLFKKADWGRPGAVWCPYTSAYPDGRTNPGDWKLDRTTAGAMTVVKGGGVLFRAHPLTSSPFGLWATGLLTTEPWDGGPCGGDGFMVQPDDFLLVHLRLPGKSDAGGHAAWPGVWTWKDGDNEIDVLEWHSESPGAAEFVNHVDGDVGGLVRSSLLGFGKWVYVGARLGRDSVTWYLGDTVRDLKAVFSDHKGVPADWKAYLILNLSVSGQPSREPRALTPITSEISGVQVYRPVAKPMGRTAP